MTFEEKTVSSERIYEGKIINVRRDQVTVENGLSYREIVEHSGGSVIAALTDDGQMIMVRQYRKPAERVMLEVPAGKIDPGEKPFDDPDVSFGRICRRSTVFVFGYRADTGRDML